MDPTGPTRGEQTDPEVNACDIINCVHTKEEKPACNKTDTAKSCGYWLKAWSLTPEDCFFVAARVDLYWSEIVVLFFTRTLNRDVLFRRHSGLLLKMRDSGPGASS